jgi:hypothetical protein
MQQRDKQEEKGQNQIQMQILVLHRPERLEGGNSRETRSQKAMMMSRGTYRCRNVQ